MKKTIIVCDGCGKELPEASKIYHINFRTSEFCDVMGESGYLTEHIDLCLNCCKDAVKSLQTIARHYEKEAK